MVPIAPTAPRNGTDKRQALLAAARRLVARSGLHNTPTSAIAREAGVAAGTLFLYFPSKEALLNALYVELIEEQHRAAEGDDLWSIWYAIARWHLDDPEASSALHQLQGSTVLTDDSRETYRRLEAASMMRLEAAVAAGFLRPLPPPVVSALIVGPILALARLAESGEVAMTEEVLRLTFDGVCRSALAGP